MSRDRNGEKEPLKGTHSSRGTCKSKGPGAGTSLPWEGHCGWRTGRRMEGDAGRFWSASQLLSSEGTPRWIH